MKDLIIKFQEHNGNVKYTVKELLAALHEKVDKLDGKVDGKISSKTFYWGFGILFTLILTIAGYVLL